MEKEREEEGWGVFEEDTWWVVLAKGLSRECDVCGY